MGLIKASLNGTTLVRDCELRRRARLCLNGRSVCESADESRWIKTIGKILIGAEDPGAFVRLQSQNGY
jgi:hypothetical protein